LSIQVNLRQVGDEIVDELVGQVLHVLVRFHEVMLLPRVCSRGGSLQLGRVTLLTWNWLFLVLVLGLFGLSLHHFLDQSFVPFERG